MKNENWLRGPTVGEFCAGTCAYSPRLYGEPGPTKVLPGLTVTFFSAGTHGCRPKVEDPQMPQRGPRDDLRPTRLVWTSLTARALNRDMSVSRTSWHKEVIIGRNSVFRVFRLYLWLSDPRFNAQSKHSC